MKIEDIKKEINIRHENRSRNPFQVENLQDKNLKDFTSDDTLYVSVTKGDYGQTYLCEFILYDERTGIVTAKALHGMTNPSLSIYEINKGLILNVKKEKISLYGKFNEDSNSHYHHCNVLGNFRKNKLAISDDANNVTNHESFGLIKFSNYTTNNSIPLFGSSIKHSKVIRLEVKKAEVKRHLGSDWNHPTENLISIDISRAQFAELISTFNSGEGVPCTITRIGDSRLESPVFENKLAQSQEEFERKIKNVVSKMETIVSETSEILNSKKPINKTEKEHILNSIDSLKQELSSNIPFITSSFAKQMDKTIEQAKLELEGFIVRKGLDNENLDLLIN